MAFFSLVMKLGCLQFLAFFPWNYPPSRIPVTTRNQPSRPTWNHSWWTESLTDLKYSLVERYVYIYIYFAICTLYTGTHVDVKPEETFSLPSLLGFFFPIRKPERQTRWLTKDSWNIYALTLLYTLLEANQTKIIPEVFLFQRAFFWCPPPKKKRTTATCSTFAVWRPSDLPHVSGARWLSFCSWQRWGALEVAIGVGGSSRGTWINPNQKNPRNSSSATCHGFFLESPTLFGLVFQISRDFFLDFFQ